MNKSVGQSGCPLENILITEMTEGYIDVSYKCKPAKMLNIFFGEVLLELEDGERVLVHETLLDSDWRACK